jgi:hypothetical protein
MDSQDKLLFFYKYGGLRAAGTTFAALHRRPSHRDRAARSFDEREPATRVTKTARSKADQPWGSRIAFCPANGCGRFHGKTRSVTWV